MTTIGFSFVTHLFFQFVLILGCQKPMDCHASLVSHSNVPFGIVSRRTKPSLMQIGPLGVHGLCAKPSLSVLQSMLLWLIPSIFVQIPPFWALTKTYWMCVYVVYVQRFLLILIFKGSFSFPMFPMPEKKLVNCVPSFPGWIRTLNNYNNYYGAFNKLQNKLF